MINRLNTIKNGIIIRKVVVSYLLMICILFISACVSRSVTNTENSKETKQNLPLETSSEESLLDEHEKLLDQSISIQDYYITKTANSYNLYYIDDENVLWGSGKNQYGQLGLGYSDLELHEEKVEIARNVIHVDCSHSGFMIYLTKSGELYGLGNDEGGALQNIDEFDYTSYHDANPTLHAISSPVMLMNDVKYARCGREDIACLTNDNSVWIWGMICIGQKSWYGEPQNVNFAAKPYKVLENAAIITGGLFNHAALLNDGTVWTWGYNYSGNCGVEGVDIVAEPTKVAEDVIDVWTGKCEFNIAYSGEVYDPEPLPPLIYEYDNTVIQKKDGSFWICGANVGIVEKNLPIYYEAHDYSMRCTWNFLPYEEACEMDPELKGFMNIIK